MGRGRRPRLTLLLALLAAPTSRRPGQDEAVGGDPSRPGPARPARHRGLVLYQNAKARSAEYVTVAHRHRGPRDGATSPAAIGRTGSLPLVRELPVGSHVGRHHAPAAKNKTRRRSRPGTRQDHQPDRRRAPTADARRRRPKPTPKATPKPTARPTPRAGPESHADPAARAVVTPAADFDPEPTANGRGAAIPEPSPSARRPPPSDLRPPDVRALVGAGAVHRPAAVGSGRLGGGRPADPDGGRAVRWRRPAGRLGTPRRRPRRRRLQRPHCPRFARPDARHDVRCGRDRDGARAVRAAPPRRRRPTSDLGRMASARQSSASRRSIRAAAGLRRWHRPPAPSASASAPTTWSCSCRAGAGRR